MKKSLAFLLVIAFAFTSCQEMFEHNDVDTNLVFNTWNLEKIETGSDTENASGETANDMLQLNEDYTYIMVENGETTEGTFELETECPSISLMVNDEDWCIYYSIEDVSETRLVYNARSQNPLRPFKKQKYHFTAESTTTTTTSGGNSNSTTP